MGQNTLRDVSGGGLFVTGEMDWYDRLSAYFPDQELKARGQIRDLLKNHTGYRKEENDDYLLLYANFPDFIFIDYLLVSPRTRGRGIGSQVMGTLKAQQKRLVAEIEPIHEDEPDTAKRVQFYKKHGFREAEHIAYTRYDERGNPNPMDIFYWSPTPVAERVVLKDMFLVCEELHNFRALKYYGREVANPDEVLEWH